MNLKHVRLSQLLFGDVLLAEPEAAAAVVAAMAGHWGISVLELAPGLEVAPETLLQGDGQQTIRQSREYQVREDGLAIIPVIGELTERSYRLQPQSGLTGYTAIGEQVAKAMADSDVTAAALDIYSPGGSGVGALDLARRIRSLSEAAGKPVWAVIGSQGTSAAYAIATAAKRVVASRLATVGSVGVIALHTDMSAALEAKGVKVTVLRAGALKAHGNPYETLSKEARERWQGRIDDVYDEFVGLVADHRGLDPDKVRATEAGVFSGSEARKLGMIDEVMPAHEAFNALSSDVNRGRKARTTQGPSLMANAPGAAGPADPTDEQRLADARKDARLEERTRITSILGHPEAEGRSKMAFHLASKTDMSVEEAVDLLAACPKDLPPPAPEKAEDPAGGLELAKHMPANPKVGPNGNAGSAEDALVAGITASYGS